MIGINNRDLDDFTVDITRTFDLLADVPAGKTVVSESGIVYREQIEELERVGVDAVLVGETVMRAPDPEAAVRQLVGGERPGLEPGSRRRSLPSCRWRPRRTSTPRRSPSSRAPARQRRHGGQGAGGDACATCSWRCSPRATC